ncbi:hypothetical protein M2138_000189 [Dysgonomonadaceae bacterium PH5-43]|nr:hypothetical protein [Dysgonomonadaceae bacterium PH5-43]
MQNILNQIGEIAINEGITIGALEKKIGASKGVLSRAIQNNTDIQSKWLQRIVENYPQYNTAWLLTGRGEMKEGKEAPRLIPFYDTEAIGGKNQYGADMAPVSAPKAYINPGDLLSDATAALRYYGDSMKEYPKGCILALRRLYDNLTRLTPGRNYVIETSEDRFTKRIQIGDSETYYMAYSSNEEKYEDGRLIHEPFRIYFEDIHKIFLVVGHIEKEALGEMLYEPLKNTKE